MLSKVLICILISMGLSGFMYYNFSVVPMKNKLEEQSKVILAQDLRDQEQKAAGNYFLMDDEKLTPEEEEEEKEENDKENKEENKSE